MTTRKHSFITRLYLPEIVKGLIVTGRHLVRNLLNQKGIPTVQYPEQKRQYSEHPPRYEYVPTQRGRDFRPVLLSLMAFGNKHFAPEGAMVEVVNTKTGKPADIGVFDRVTGLPIVAPDYAMVPGPAAPARVKQRYARRNVEAGAA